MFSTQKTYAGNNAFSALQIFGLDPVQFRIYVLYVVLESNGMCLASEHKLSISSIICKPDNIGSTQTHKDIIQDLLLSKGPFGFY